jgi:hypothetical protein
LLVVWRDEVDYWLSSSSARDVRVEKEGADVTTLTASPLTATDRCDRCGAQAYIRATLASGSELLFCAHHAREYETGLRAIEAEIYNEADRLDETPPMAALEER